MESNDLRIGEVARRAKVKMRNIDEKIRTLEGMRGVLLRLMSVCKGRGAITECPILDALEDDDP